MRSLSRLRGKRRHIRSWKSCCVYVLHCLVSDSPSHALFQVKQSENALFAFLTPSHELHAYYCFVRDRKPYQQPRTEDTSPPSVAKPAVGLLGEEYAEEVSSCASTAQSIGLTDVVSFPERLGPGAAAAVRAPT